ncbi:E3 ubiquitin-protein ligase TRIM45-like isoform X2 [Oculina patagonica]
MESLLKNLKKQVTCSICLDTYTKPKTITCLHTFCLECLKKHALTSQRQGKYRCPNCQEEVGIPEGNCFDKLPTSFLHNSLLSLLAVRQIGDGSEISCGTCKKKSAEIGYCFDCEKLLCPDCVNAHEVFQATAAAFEGHKVTPVKQFQAQDYEALLKRKSFCSQKYHEREVTKFFCLECQTCVCQVCINTVHKNHNIDPLEKAADGEKANIMAGVKLMKEKRKVFSDVMRQLEDTASKLEDNVNTAIREVSQAAEEMIATIREREQETITALKKTRGSRTKTLDCAKKQMQSSTKRIDQAVEFANNLVRGSSDLDIMQSNKNLEQRFEDLNKTPVPAVPVKERQLDVVGELDLKGEIPQEPHGIAVNSKRLIAVADGEGHCVLIFNQEGKFVRKIGCCGKNPGQFIGPAGVTYLNDDEILVADDENHRIQQFNVQTGNFVKSFGKQGSGEGEFKNPESVCMDGEGRIVVADYFNNRIQVLTKDGKPVFKFGGSSLPTGCICHKNRFIVSDFGNDCLKVFDCSGKFLYKFGKAGEAEGQLSHPWGLCVEKYGNRQNLLVCDSNNGRIQQFTMEGCFTGKTVTGLQAPTYIATTPDGRILVSDCKAQKIYVIK